MLPVAFTCFSIRYRFDRWAALGEAFSHRCFALIMPALVEGMRGPSTGATARWEMHDIQRSPAGRVSHAHVHVASGIELSGLTRSANQIELAPDVGAGGIVEGRRIASPLPPYAWSASGSVRVTVVPCPILLVTTKSPPIPRASSRLIGSPSPVPSCGLESLRPT